MSYVVAGYIASLGGLFVYAVTLVLRRRRWERALAAASDVPPAEPDGTAAHGERP